MQWALTGLGLALLVLLVLPSAQIKLGASQLKGLIGSYTGGGGWVPCDANGNPLPSGDPGLNSDGSAALLHTGSQPTASNTYPVPQTGADPWWYGCYSPRAPGGGPYSTGGGSYPGSGGGLSTSSTAGNSVTGQTGGLSTIGYYDTTYYSGDRPGNSPTPPDLNGTVSTNGSDTLKAYFLWTGPDPVPTQATFFVQTSVSASASVGYGSSGQTGGLSATATATLGSDTVTANAGDAGSPGSQAGGSWQTQQVSPSGNIATVSLTASASTTTKNTQKYATWTGNPSSTYYYNGPGAGQTGANASATDKGSVFPAVTISLPGAINDIDGTKKALTGQGVTAQLSAFPAGYKVSSYTWSFTGGTPIKNWDPTSTSNDKTVPLAPTDLSATDITGNGITVADLSFYYTKAGSLTVTCTINYTSPDGKTGTTTVQSPSVKYLKPTVTWLLTNYNPTFRHPKGFFADPPNQQYGAEEPWGPINISVPDPFSGGHGYIAQIATLGRSFTRYNPQLNMPDTSYKRVSVLYNGGTQGAVDTPTGLDISYPYPYGYTKGGTATKPIFTLVNSNYTWEVGSTGYSDDQPFQYYTTTDVDGGGSLWHDSGVNDSFDTWVMYQPPSAGGGTIYVPLMKLTWRWGGFASRYRTSSGVWSAWTSGAGTPFDEGSPAVTDAYPSWPLSIPKGVNVGP